MGVRGNDLVVVPFKQCCARSLTDPIIEQILVKLHYVTPTMYQLDPEIVILDAVTQLFIETTHQFPVRPSEHRADKDDIADDQFGQRVGWKLPWAALGAKLHRLAVDNPDIRPSGQHGERLLDVSRVKNVVRIQRQDVVT